MAPQLLISLKFLLLAHKIPTLPSLFQEALICFSLFKLVLFFPPKCSTFLVMTKL
jgi:hypothetical protein